MLNRELKAGGGKIISMLAKLATKADDAAEAAAKTSAKSKKAAMPAQQEIDDYAETLINNPQKMDEISADEYQELVDSVSPKMRAKLMGDDMSGAATDDTVSMMRGMEPEDVADNLSYFNTLDEIRTYTQGLDAGETRRFVNNINAEDEDLFEGLADYVKTLGPREMKNDGGKMAGLLVPVEMEMEDNLKPDMEMEDDYVDYILQETLSDEEYNYLDDQLSKDDKLSVLFDKIILSASEFTGAGEVDGPGNGTSDEIPARLSDGEFVFTKKAVDEIGVDKLQQMMKDAESAADERNGKATGGLMDKQTPTAQMNTMQQQDEEMNRYMLQSNRMPSIR